MDQVELDAAYDQAAYAPLIGQIQKRFATSSETTRARLGAPKRLAYGPNQSSARPVPASNAQCADHCIHPRWRLACAAGKGLRVTRPRCSSTPARNYVVLGLRRASKPPAATSADGRSGAPRGRLGLQECRGASAAIRSGFTSSGQSSGAHSAASHGDRLEKEYGVPADVVKGALLARACTTSSRCGCRSARRTSPSPTRWRRSCPRSAISTGSTAPVIVAYGTFETPEFQRQNRDCRRR